MVNRRAAPGKIQLEEVTDGPITKTSALMTREIELKYYLFDVFTSRQFGGNPLAVFPDGDGIPTDVMQMIANELNLSETTFIQQPQNRGSDCTVRIFTPKKELPMAGHPTIGTAYAILTNRLLTSNCSDYLVFDEGVGPVRVDFSVSEGRPVGLFMHQPLPEFSQIIDRATIAELLSVEIHDVSEPHPVQVVSCGVPLILVPLNSLDAVRRAKVRADLLETRLQHIGCQELFVFSLETEQPESHVHCRMFAPRFGVPEDPATGGAHGPLGGYLFRYGLSDGREIVSEQGIEMGRPSRIFVRVLSSGDQITDVLVGGDCAEVGSGTIRMYPAEPA